jgi:hypothetical protein
MMSSLRTMIDAVIVSRGKRNRTECRLGVNAERHARISRKRKFRLLIVRCPSDGAVHCDLNS